MNNIFEKRQEILQNIDFGSILESVKPSTIAGDKYLRSLIQFVNEGKANSISAVSGIASTCLNQFRQDSAIFNIGESLVEKLNENIDPMIVYCYESIGRHVSENNILAIQLSKKLENIVVMESSKEKTAAIRSGMLAPYRSINESVSLLESSVSIKTEQITETATHEAYNPIVYIERVDENTYLRLGNNIFSMTEDNLSKTVSPSYKFNFMSSIVEELKWNDVEKAFVYTDNILGEFKINENSITRKSKDNETIFENNNDFVKHMSILTESLDNKRNANLANNLFDSLISVKENFDNFVKADNVVIVENKYNHEKYALVILENSNWVCTLQSVRYPNIVEKFDRIDSALETLKKKSGFSADGFVTEQLKQIEALDSNKKLIVESYSMLIESLNEKEQEILTAIDIAKRSNQPNKVAKLNESLLLTRAHLTEQKNNFSEKMK